jgi:trk system potassium uptake protein TrkA
MYVIIVGGGGIGKTLATHLVSEGHEVVIIEKDAERAKYLAEQLDCIIIHGDGSITEVLKDAGVERADAGVVLTSDDNINLTICQILKKFNVEKIVARVNEPAKKDLYIDLEITASISLVSAAVSQFKNTLTQESGRCMQSIAGGNAEVLELKIGNEKLDHKKIKDIGLPNGALIGVVYRNGEAIIASPDTILKKKDVVTLITKSDAKKDAIAILK